MSNVSAADVYLDGPLSMSSRASSANPSVHGEYVASDHAGLFGR
jgi:hypothetical protein